MVRCDNGHYKYCFSCYVLNMDNEKSTYRSISKSVHEVIYRSRKSKFIGFAFPVTTEIEVSDILSSLRQQHAKANHFCYAYKIGHGGQTYRANDDGEPKNSAGKPIYGQLVSLDLTNVLVVVVRYFGGIKLGVGGLIHAYRTTAQMTLESCTIITKTVTERFELKFNYDNLNGVMRILKKVPVTIISQEINLTCKMQLTVSKNKIARLKNEFVNLKEVEFRQI